jgi:hypothetical protein
MTPFVGKPGNLMQNGPLVAVKLCVPKEVKPTMTPIDTLAEIDTSIVVTRIQEGVATSLGLEPAGMVKIMTDTTPAYDSYLYRIRLQFSPGEAFEADAIEVPYMVRPNVRIKCVIGRDILKHAVLTYNGCDNVFTLEFRG